MPDATPPPPRRRTPRLLDELTGTIADAAVRGVDLQQAINSVDLDAQIERVDINRVLDRVDTTRLLDRVDVDRLLDQVDVDRLLEQVDVNQLLDRVDVDRLLDRVDVDRLLERAGIEEIVRRSTSGVASNLLDVARRQVVAVDLIVMRVLYRLTGRHIEQLPAGPDALLEDTADPVLRPDEVDDPREVVGRYAGLLPRVLAAGLDLAIATGILTSLIAAATWLAQTVFGLSISGGATSGTAYLVTTALWVGLYWVATLATTGRSPGMALVGVRLVRRDGSPLPLSRVVVWTAVHPASAILGLGWLVLLVGSHRQTLHDRLSGAVMVYDWGRRGAAAETPLSRWIADHA